MTILVSDVVTITTRHEDSCVVPASVDTYAEGDEVGSFRMDLSAGRSIRPMRNVGRESRHADRRKANRAKKKCNSVERKFI